MTTTAIEQKKPSFFDVFLGEPLDLIKSQPHQVFISVASVTLMGSFAGSSNILHPIVGYLLAIGIEWAYFRGLASDSKAPTIWGSILNYSACGIVLLWGMLWVAHNTGGLEGINSWWLAAAHVIPIAWLSLCSAQTHHAAMVAEAHAKVQATKRAEEIAEAERLEQLEFDRQQREEDEKLRRWAEAQRLKSELKLAEKAANINVDATPQNGIVPETKGKTAICAKCQKDVAWTTPSEAGTIRRWGCAECRSKSVGA